MTADTASLSFLGATGTVTGSKFLVDTDTARVLVDCGLFQGLKELRLRNWAPLPVSPASIDAVVVSHAHLDHCGYLPALVRDGFTGTTTASRGTAELARIVLLDSAHLQEEDADYAARKGFSKHRHPQPLYTTGDAEKALQTLRPTTFGQAVPLAPGVEAELAPAGHILGSSTVLVRLAGSSLRVLFSGDLGRPLHPLLVPPAAPPAADVVLVESTYGDRTHDDEALERFADAIRRTVRRGGSVLVPAFAVDRTEVVLHQLRTLRAAGAIPDVPVYVDSPMALAALGVYRQAVAEQWPEVRADIARDGDPFDAGVLHEAHTVEESKALNDPSWPSIILSASGMATGGRVLHHLAAMLPDSRNSVVLAGFQAVGTRGRQLAEGARQVKLHGRYVPVRAEVVDVPAFSVHADGDEVLGWLASSPQEPRVCFVVHGEPHASAQLRDRIDHELGWNVVVPRDGERVRLD